MQSLITRANHTAKKDLELQFYLTFECMNTAGVWREGEGWNDKTKKKKKKGERREERKCAVREAVSGQSHVRRTRRGCTFVFIPRRRGGRRGADDLRSDVSS